MRIYVNSDLSNANVMLKIDKFGKIFVTVNFPMQIAKIIFFTNTNGEAKKCFGHYE